MRLIRGTRDKRDTINLSLEMISIPYQRLGVALNF